jgi:hypothetical protein
MELLAKSNNSKIIPNIPRGMNLDFGPNAQVQVGFYRDRLSADFYTPEDYTVLQSVDRVFVQKSDLEFN